MLAPALMEAIASRRVTAPSTATLSPVPVTVIVAASAAVPTVQRHASAMAFRTHDQVFLPADFTRAQKAPGIAIPPSVQSCCCVLADAPRLRHGDRSPTSIAEGLLAIFRMIADRFRIDPRVQAVWRGMRCLGPSVRWNTTKAK